MSRPDHIERSRVVYSESAALYVDVIGTSVTDEIEAAEDRAVLGAFVELVTGGGPGPVLDAGCGPGRVARFLTDAGVAPVSGIDLAPGMVAAARAAHPDLAFGVGELTRLPVADAALVGIVSWYSIITTPPDGLAAVWAEFDRALSPDGVALIAFQAGRGETAERPNAYGTTTDLTLYRHDVDEVCAGVENTSLRVRSVLRRRPRRDGETTDQAFVIADRSAVW